MDLNARNWVREQKRGCVLYTSPSLPVRIGALQQLAKAAVCKTGQQPCECADCTSVALNSHPEVVLVGRENFVERMNVLYSYPTPVIQFMDIHTVSMNLQTKMLIWLEMFSKDRLVIMTADTEFSVLPTIRSRSVVFTEIPNYHLSEEDKFKAQIFLQALISGKMKHEEITQPDDAKRLASLLRLYLLQEMQARMSTPPRRSLGCSDQDVTILMKVLDRYFQNTETHNLRLLLSGFTAHIIQNIR
jgi:hypothetical protein